MIRGPQPFICASPYHTVLNADELGGRQWCEHAVPEFLPALRAGIAFSLATDHRMSQREIADRMGLTQAAVSHYITRRRGRRPRRRDHRLRKYGKLLAGRIATDLSGPRLPILLKERGK